MKRRTIILISTVLFVVFGLAVGLKFVSAYAPKEAAPDQLPRNQTLYIAGIQWDTPTNFNPLNGGAAWPCGGNLLLTYETLFAYNQLTGALDPLLAQSYEIAADNHAVTVTLQDGTMWQDGYPLTIDDVIYTYELAKSQAVNYSDLYNYISQITSTLTRTLQITLNSEQINPGMVKNYLTQIKILPMHIWQARGDNLTEYVDIDPIGSGPYKLNNYSPESIVLFRDDDYWGKAVFGLPVPRYVVHNIYASNDDILQAFANGEVDMSQSYILEIWKMWEEQGLPIGTWFDQPPYHLPASIPILLINTMKPGLDNPLVRRALAYSIDYSTISSSVWGYSAPVSSSLILPTGSESALFSPTQVAQYGWTYDPAMAQDILENQLGATKGADGVYVLPDATRLGPWSTRCPNSWNDWQFAITATVQNAHDAGFDLYADFPDWSWDYYVKLQVGDFDLAMLWTAGSGPSTPWQRFRDMLDPRDVPPIGESAPWNFGRFIDPDVPALLDLAGQAVDPITVKDTYDQLDKIFMDNAVDIPMMYRPNEFYEFNRTYWARFPTSIDPSAPPMFSGAGIEVLYKIAPIQSIYLPVVTR